MEPEKPKLSRREQYAIRQHDLICEVAGVPNTPDECGSTAHEVYGKLDHDIQQAQDRIKELESRVVTDNTETLKNALARIEELEEENERLKTSDAAQLDVIKKIDEERKTCRTGENLH
jgi:FtsZ-binding cell division protein ZapB